MIDNAIGRKRLKRQARLRLLGRILSVLLLLLAIAAAVLLPGWWKAVAVIAIPVVLMIEARGNEAYDRLFYDEREKEQLARHLRRCLPDCRVAVNQPLEEQIADLLVAGPAGIFVVGFTQLSYDCIDENVDRHVMEIQAAAQRICPGYPVEGMIYARQMSMLKPAITRLTAVHSPSGVVDCIGRSRRRCSDYDIERICTLLGWEEELQE